jgi:hypothetical protein
MGEIYKFSISTYTGSHCGTIQSEEAGEKDIMKYENLPVMAYFQ